MAGSRTGVSNRCELVDGGNRDGLSDFEHDQWPRTELSQLDRSELNLSISDPGRFVLTHKIIWNHAPPKGVYCKFC